MTDITHLSVADGKIKADDACLANPWIIVTQYKSNRVVYFTDDSEYQPPMDGDWYYCSTYLGALPDGMTLRNCWGWRFNGGVFTDAREEPRKSTEERLIESNRKALLHILHEKINKIRELFLPSCAGGESVRLIKLEQAHAYLNAGGVDNRDRSKESGPASGKFEQLQAVAVARNISMLQAAKLVVTKAEETQAVLLETERFREQLTQAIQSAKTETKLLELREWLLDRVYPELTRHFKLRSENIEPIDLDALLNDVERLHEITRLKAQLREAINQKRAPIQSDYIHNDELRRHKARLAQRLLENNGVKPDGVDYGLLEAYAEGRNLNLSDAAQLIVNSMAVTGELLAHTERIKDQMLARIDAIKTLRDIETVEQTLKSLGEKQ